MKQSSRGGLLLSLLLEMEEGDQPLGTEAAEEERQREREGERQTETGRKRERDGRWAGPF